MATAKQLAALKKARAARKKNLAAKRKPAKRKAAPAKRKTTAKKKVVRKNPVKKRASNTGVVYASRSGAKTKYYYTGERGDKAFNSDRAMAKKVGYTKAMSVAKTYISKMPQGYGIHFTGKKK